MNWWICSECIIRRLPGVFQEREIEEDKACPSFPLHGNLSGPFSQDEIRDAVAMRRARETWRRAIEKARRITKGSFKGSLHLSAPYYLEMLDPKHQYGPRLQLLFQQWAASQSNELFLKWLETANRGRDFKGVIQIPPEKLVSCHQIGLLGDQINPPAEFMPDWWDNVDRGRLNHLMFVVDRNDNIYVAPKIKGRLHHSSFFHGAPVKMAGMFKVDRWQLTGISNASGHYAPGVRNLASFLEKMRDEAGMPLNLIHLDFWDGQAWTFQGPAEVWLRQNWLQANFVFGGHL